MRHLTLFLVLLLTACGEEMVPPPEEAPYVRVARRVMGTEAQVIVYGDDRTKALAAAEQAFKEIERLETVLSDYDPESELMKLCAASHDQPVPVSRDLYDALSLALDLARRTRGIYDPTVGAITHLWREAKEADKPPSDEAMAEAQGRVGWQRVELHPPTRAVRFTTKGMQLDFGGFGKGYAAQVAWTNLAVAGFTRSMVEIGGDMIVGDPPPDTTHWHVGAGNAPILSVRNRAVAASGPAERSIVINGKRYGHIIDPRTGQPVANGQSSVVVAADAASADVFATVFCILPVAEGVAAAEGIGDVEASVGMPGGGASITSGYGAFLGH